MLKALQARTAWQNRLSVIDLIKVSDSDLPSETPEPRTGILTVANERLGRGGEAERDVSLLKRSGGCFQFLFFRLIVI
jgi:hypothetical protein